MIEPPRHEALHYAGPARFVPAYLSVAQDALSRDERVILLAAQDRLDEVYDAVGLGPDEVTFVPTDRHGRNPSRITTLLDSFQSAAAGRRSLAVTDWGQPSRSTAVFSETQLAESLLNVVGSSWPLDVVCFYDTTALAPRTLAEVRRVHPAVRGEPDNADYEPDLAAALFAAALLAAPDDVEMFDIGPDELAGARRAVSAFATAHGLPHDRTQDFVMAANEIVTNSMRHGGGSCRLTLWEEDGALVCEIVDSGYIADPFVGRLAPSPTAVSGRGLWLANQLCDLVQLRSSPAGTVVRLFVDHL